MKTALQYATKDAILADREIFSVNERAKLIQEFNQLHANDAPTIPLPTADERRQMTDLGRTLTLARDEWVNLEVTEKKIAAWLPEAVQEHRRLEIETPLDAPSESIDALIRLDRRIPGYCRGAGIEACQ